jgi:NAD(P)H-flavin reductase
VKAEAARYTNLWIPSVSFWSFPQTHPFTVVSWAATAQGTLDLLIEPRSGLTRELLDHAKRGYTIDPIVMFSGPHGMDLAIDKYESILMVASGFGITAFLPYLKKLIHDYNAREGRARRIHVVWQITDRGRLVVTEFV